MSDLRELYQETIIGHAKSPRNFGKLLTANRKIEGYNPLCGDRLTLYLDVADDKVRDLKFEGSGCAISTASASLMTETIKGRKLDDALQLIESFHTLVTGPMEDAEKNAAPLGKLAVFAGVCEFPARVKCASLCWHSLKAAIRNEGDSVSTE